MNLYETVETKSNPSTAVVNNKNQNNSTQTPNKCQGWERDVYVGWEWNQTKYQQSETLVKSLLWIRQGCFKSRQQDCYKDLSMFSVFCMQKINPSPSTLSSFKFTHLFIDQSRNLVKTTVWVIFLSTSRNAMINFPDNK